MSKVTGTVKWFSNRKGFGFISPTSDNSPTQEEIFVHQTSIFSDGSYRTLAENAEVEFEVEKEQDTGKYKAVNVTAVGGGSLKPPPRERRRDRHRKPKGSGDESGDASHEEGENAEGGTNGRRTGRGSHKKHSDDDKPKDPPFHHHISDDVKEKIKQKGVELDSKSTVDVAIGGARIKLGQGGYAGLADAGGIIGEGTYTCDDNGLITFEWERSLAFTDGEWKSSDASKLMKTLSLIDDGIGPVNLDETPETLWGSDKTDPRSAFEANGFQMRRVVLTRPPGGRGRRGGHHKKH